MNTVEALHTDDRNNDLRQNTESLSGPRQRSRVFAPELRTARNALLGDEYLSILVPRLALGRSLHRFEHRGEHPRIRQKGTRFVRGHTMAFRHARNERLDLGRRVEGRRAGRRARPTDQQSRQRDSYRDGVPCPALLLGRRLRRTRRRRSTPGSLPSRWSLQRKQQEWSTGQEERTRSRCFVERLHAHVSDAICHCGSESP